MKFDIVTIGGAVQDITFYTSEGIILDNPKKDPECLKLLGFEYGAKIKIDEANFSFGGGSQNAAVSFSRLGFKTASCAAVGNDGTGANIIKNLKSNKVNIKFIKTIDDIGTGFSFVLTDKKTSEHVIFSYRGANTKLKVTEQELKKINTKWIYMTSLSGNWENGIVKNIFSHKNKNGAKVAWNPGKRQLESGFKKLKKYFKDTDVLSLNKDEATELLSSGSAKDLACKLVELTGTGIVVITDGKRGAYACEKGKLYYSSIINVKRVDTTGVGDAFCSSFVAGLELYNGNIKKALDLGNLNTSKVIGKVGAENGLMYRESVKSV
ncbi:carbohydrate kinase family protein [Patescibacteria group bacterium]